MRNKTKPVANKPFQFKFIYQLLSSQLIILTLAFLVLSFSFSKFVENYIFENKVEELIDFGTEIKTNYLENNLIPMANLRVITDILDSRNIRFMVFNEFGQIMYSSHLKAPTYLLEEEEWNELIEGNIIINKQDVKRFSDKVSVVTIPIIKDDKFLGGIFMISPVTKTLVAASELNRILFNTILLAFVVVILFSGIFSKNLIKRITALRKATSMISKGNYDVHLNYKYEDEFSLLFEDFNVMASKLKKSDEEIMRLENRRRKFIADLSHEMRTPLTTIAGVADGIQNKLIPLSELDKGMDLINRESKRLIRLVNENLDYEKIRSNNLKLHQFQFQLLDILLLIEEQLSILAEEKNNTIIVDVDEAILVYADYDRFFQIIYNIVKNGIQFTNNGTIYLRGEETEDNTIIHIQDTGIGINKEELELIWDRFYKADLSRTGNTYGEFGIGLSIVKQLVSLHGGTIEVESEKNKGTTFTIRLPKQ